MSLIQNFEIDTLRIRNLIVKSSTNVPIPSSNMLYAAGDGTTYWSTGVTAAQFATLSTQVTSNASTFSTALTQTKDQLLSTIINYSSVAYNLSTTSSYVQYTNSTNAALASTISTVLSSYQTLRAQSTFSTQITLALLSTSSGLQSTINDISSIVSSNFQIVEAQISDLTGGISTLISTNNSTIQGIYSIESTIYDSTISLVNGLGSIIASELVDISTTIAQNYSTTLTYPVQVAASASTLSTAIIATVSLSTLSAANSYTSTLGIVITSTTNQGLSSLRSTLELELKSTLTPYINSNNSSITGLQTSFNVLSTDTNNTIIAISTNISTLLATGLVQNIYSTFIELQSYSANLVTSTIAANSKDLQSTISSYTFIYDSTLTFINISSFNYLVANAYLSSISTVVPLTLSTMEAVVASTVSTFNSTISGEAVNFSTLVYSQASTLSSILYEESQTYISTASSLLLTISAYTVSSISTLDAYVESTISVITLLVEVNISTISTAFFNQFVTAPSIILYNVVGISTLTNTAPITALDSLNASVADLDVTTYENFYILLSDLSNDVYYGLSYSTNSVTYNKNITVQIDIQSTYTNKFYIFDLDSFPAWLNRAPIYNPKSFSFLTNDLIQVPTNDTTPQVYISSFIGSYILNFRLTQTAMYINSIDCFPFVFSQLRLTGMTIPTNVQTTNPVFSNAFNLMYCGSRMSMTWDTNDLNIPLGVKFIGKDYVGSTIISWSGPYPSGTRSANIKIPTAPTPFAVYNSMYLGIFPNTASLNATTDGNIHTTSMLFDQSTFSKPFGVVSPTLNSRITVKNPGTINQFLQVSELKVTNIKQQNVVTDYLNQYARLTSSNFISVYNTDYGTYGPQRAFDGNLSTFYQGGFTTGTPDVNNKFYGAFSTFDTKYESTVFISTVEITGYVTSLSGMQIRYENANIQPSPYFATTYAAITDNTFYSTITLKSTYRQVFTFN